MKIKSTEEIPVEGTHLFDWEDWERQQEEERLSGPPRGTTIHYPDRDQIWEK